MKWKVNVLKWAPARVEKTEQIIALVLKYKEDLYLVWMLQYQDAQLLYITQFPFSKNMQT